MAQLKTGTTIDGNTAWHAGNDGSGSTLDADLLDGSHKADITKLSAMATVKVDGNSLVSANALSQIILQPGSSSHRFYKYSIYGNSGYVIEGVSVDTSEAVLAAVHTNIARYYAGGADDLLQIINGSGTGQTVYYKVYQFIE